MLSYLWLNAWSFLQKNVWRSQSTCCWTSCLPADLQPEQACSVAWPDCQSARCREEQAVAAGVQGGSLREGLYTRQNSAPRFAADPCSWWGCVGPALQGWLGTHRPVSGHLCSGTDSVWHFSPCPQILSLFGTNVVSLGCTGVSVTCLPLRAVTMPNFAQRLRLLWALPAQELRRFRTAVVCPFSWANSASCEGPSTQLPAQWAGAVC